MKLTTEQKEANKAARKAARQQAKEAARIEKEKNQKPVKAIAISIEWKKSRTWGTNPRLEADVYFKDGTSARFSATCSGCGYDKESTVIADVFNTFLKYKLYEDRPASALPYGVYKMPHHLGYGDGIGVSSYYSIAEYIGGKLERVASGKTFDAYKYTDLQ